MREIDFIALKYSEDKWVRGNLCGDKIIPRNSKVSHTTRDFTISQFTGLVTYEGHRIYENSILEIISKEIPLWIVEFKKGCFVLRSKTIVPEYHTFYEWYDTIITNARVVGTIFDEDIEKRNVLLKKKKEKR